ncbi:MAG: hypothetical protein ACI3V5_01185 [Faecousia sp.]
MNKRTRQYVGLLSAVLAYYFVHEGAHFVYALSINVFQRINFLGLGVQIAIYSEGMSNLQLGIFCLVGPAATTVTAYVLTLTAPQICRTRSMVFRACMYYITIAMLLIDPLYLSVLCGLFGGGDMNGIALLLPEWIARLCFGVLLVIHCLLLWIAILPKYRKPFAESSTQ